MKYWSAVSAKLDEMVNQWYETPEIRRLLEVPLTPARLELRRLHMTHFGKNRRDCWAAVQSKAPLDVKRAIWEHEKDELIFDHRMRSLWPSNAVSTALSLRQCWTLDLETQRRGIKARRRR